MPGDPGLDLAILSPQRGQLSSVPVVLKCRIASIVQRAAWCGIACYSHRDLYCDVLYVFLCEIT